MDGHKNLAFLRRLTFAFSGIVHGFRGERSLRVQGAALLTVLLGISILRPPPVWWAMVILASSGVLAAELLNTAVERLADRLHPEIHPEIRIVKDCAAGAVLVSSCGAVGVAIALLVDLLR